MNENNIPIQLQFYFYHTVARGNIPNIRSRFQGHSFFLTMYKESANIRSLGRGLQVAETNIYNEYIHIGGYDGGQTAAISIMMVFHLQFEPFPLAFGYS